MKQARIRLAARLVDIATFELDVHHAGEADERAMRLLGRQGAKALFACNACGRGVEVDAPPRSFGDEDAGMAALEALAPAACPAEDCRFVGHGAPPPPRAERRKEPPGLTREARLVADIQRVDGLDEKTATRKARETLAQLAPLLARLDDDGAAAAPGLVRWPVRRGAKGQK